MNCFVEGENRQQMASLPDSLDNYECAMQWCEGS
jgi:hypothetical protein